MGVKGTILKRAKVDSKSENLIDFMQKIKAVCDTYQDEFEGIANSAVLILGTGIGGGIIING